MTESTPNQNLLVPIVLVFVLFLALAIFPPLGALIGVLSPFPLVFVALQKGRQVSIALMALVFVTLLLLVGADQATLFLAEYALLALLLGEMIRYRLSADRCIALSAVVTSLVSLVVLMVLFGDQETSVKVFFEEQIRAHFAQSMKSFESIGESPAEVASMKAFAERTAESFAGSYPAFLFIGSLISTAANYALVRIAWTRLYGSGLFSEGKFSEWICLENLVWLFIGSGVALFIGQGEIEEAGLNVFLVMLFIYFIQGLSIVVYFLKARNVQVFFWFVLFILIFVQPLLIGLVAGLGVFDIWADFRKLRIASAEDI
mgnify:FL=1